MLRYAATPSDSALVRRAVASLVSERSTRASLDGVFFQQVVFLPAFSMHDFHYNELLNSPESFLPKTGNTYLEIWDPRVRTHSD